MPSGQLLHLRDPEFKPEMLEYVKQDPVHDYSLRPIDARIREDRNIFFLTVNGAIAGVLCVAFTNGIPGSITHIFDLSSPLLSLRDASHAIFYSVFKTNAATEIKNVGAELINSAARWILNNLPNISNFVTMSPIPSLTTHFKEPPDEDQIKNILEEGKDPVARFHLGNGAQVYRILPNADPSDKRQEQSWGWMVNYLYDPKQDKDISQ